MIKTTTRNLVEGFSAFMKLSQERLPVALALKLKRILKQVQADVRDFEEQRVALIEKYTYIKNTKTGERDFNNEEDKPLFDEEMKSILDTEVEILGQRVGLNELNDLTVTASDLLVLEWLFEEEETDPLDKTSIIQ